MYKSIVVGTDGSPTAARAVEQAIALAQASGAVLHVLNAHQTVDVLPSAEVAGGRAST